METLGKLEQFNKASADGGLGILPGRAPGWALIVGTILALWLTACGVRPAQPEPVSAVAKSEDQTTIQVTSVDSPVTTATAEAFAADIPAVMSLRQVLVQQLHSDVASVQIVSVEEMTWPDRCLGAPQADELCAPAETPGYRITLAVNGDQYTFHTDLDGNQIRPVGVPEPSIGERILTWFGSDDSGCQTVEVGSSGVAFGRCGRPLIGVPFSFDTRQGDVAEFAANYATFAAETPAGTVDFKGQGPDRATPAEQRMIAEWARLVWSEAQAGRSGASWGLIFAWHREGGPAGFCDDVAVYVTGDVYVSSCQGEQPVDLGRIRLNADQLATVFNWVDTWQPAEQELNDPAATVQLVFAGAGTQPIQEPEWVLFSDFAQNLYNEVSMLVKEAPAVCPTPAASQQLLLDEAHGYCLLYPAEYSLIRSGPDAIEIVLGTVMNHVDPRVSIVTEDGRGRTLDDVAAQLEADYVPPGFEVERNYISAAGVEAVMLDNLPGQDLNRRLVFIQNERLFSLLFAPIGDEGSETRQQAEALYQQVLDSFRFLNETTSAGQPSSPESGDNAALVWSGSILPGGETGGVCSSLTLTTGSQALVGPCDGAQTEVPLSYNHDQDWTQILARFAPFELETPAERIDFRGQGEISGPAWERAITAWARISAAELGSGKVSATGRTVLAWTLGELPDQPGSCRRLIVLIHGYAVAATGPCQGGPTESSTGGWIDTADWEQFDRWLYGSTPLYQDDNYLDGRGSRAMSANEVEALSTWARTVYDKFN